MGGLTSAPYFTTRTPVQFLAADAPSLNITGATSLINNPAVFNVPIGSQMTSVQGIDGLNYISGAGEFPPFYLELQWKQLGYNDYLKLAALAPYYLTFVSYRNIGYYGKLLLEGPKSAGVKTADVLQLKAQFFVLSPSDAGGAATVNRIATPTSLSVTNSNTANTGYIPASQATYYWLTFSSKYGETLPQASGSISNTNANTYNSISWTWPSSTAYCEKASIYVSNTNSQASSKLLGEVPNGLSATWSDYVGYQSALVNRQPPTASTAYRGQWMGSIWTNETP